MTATAMKVAARQARVVWGLSTPRARLESQNIATDLRTEGEGPTTYR